MSAKGMFLNEYLIGKHFLVIAYVNLCINRFKKVIKNVIQLPQEKRGTNGRAIRELKQTGCVSLLTITNTKLT